MLLRLRAGVASVLAVAVLLWSAAPACADAGSFLYSRKLYGALSMASSVFFFKAAYDAKQDANRNYKIYRSADTPVLATTSYNEARRGDTRMAVMLGLGVGTLAYGAYLFLDRGGDDAGQGTKGKQPKQISVKGIGVDVQGDAQGRGVKLQLNRKF